MIPTDATHPFRQVRREVATSPGAHELAARVAGLNSDDLAKKSGSSEWDVAQVLSHLGSGAEIAFAGLEAGKAGREEAPGQDFNQSVWDRWNAMSAQENADGFLAANERLVTAFESLDATTREELRVKLSFVPFPADVALRRPPRRWSSSPARSPFCSGFWPKPRSSTAPRPRCGSRRPTPTGCWAWSWEKASA